MIDEDLNTYCPICGCPTVLEDGVEVCYYCGWSENMEEDVNWI